MKEKMQEWAKSNWGNLSEKSAKSVVNRVVAVMEKNPTTLKSALVGLTQSLNALASKEDTTEQDTAELWFISEFITAMLLPIADHIDAITKANANTNESPSRNPRVAGFLMPARVAERATREKIDAFHAWTPCRRG